ncbi:MAG TPA: dihydropteroate synthase [Terriglobales bacterium]|nr:dihydropteroate synthase [Terriglobales bacterium]
MRPVFQWNVGSRVIDLGKRTLIMGVLNVTPDSFSDGGRFSDPQRALEQACKMLDDDADIIDIGGESTRPGAHVLSRAEQKPEDARAVPRVNAGVTEQEELDRVIPVIETVKRERPTALISVDTYKAGVARAAVVAGAEIVNDVSGLRWDARIIKTLAPLKCGVVLMHMRGRPEEWRNLPAIGDPVLLVKRELKQWAEDAVLGGIKRDRIVLDPGFGFGKKFDENYPLISRFEQLQALGFPLLVGTSRKSFIGRTLGRNGSDAAVNQRLFGSVATQTALIIKGAHIVRTHDVREAVEAARVADAIVNA